jgi:penicillin-binding protein-related factor A (putative recombinase)
MKNNGKNSENIFEAYWGRLPTFADVYRFEDYADANFKASGRTRKIVAAKPSDYIITILGRTFYAEVKSIASGSRFNFSNIKASQWRSATKVSKASGEYFFFIHFLTSDRWYKVPAQAILRAEKKSLLEKDLLKYYWEPRQTSTKTKN